MRIISKNWKEKWKEIWKKNRAHFKSTIIDNPYIPHKPFKNQVYFLTYPSEELLYGGQAGGGKSDALLMSALQYVGKEFIPEGERKNTYSALLLRRTYQDLAKPSAIMDRCREWLAPFVEVGEVRWNGHTKTYIFPSGATVGFGYLAHDNHLDQYQGAELQFVGFDELTQFTERQYTYLHSRLRKLKNSKIPIRMRAGSNPGGRGHEWVKARFVSDKSNLPFIPSAYTDNLYLDVEQYGKQLDKLDPLTRQQLKYGDWDALIHEGLLVNRNILESRMISYNDFKDWEPIYTTIGVDPASTGYDKFAMSCLVYFNTGKIVLVDLDATPVSNPEENLKNFIIRNQKWLPRLVNFEKEGGSAPHYALNYWRNTLFELSNELGFYIMDTSGSSVGGKFNRARPHANLVRQGVMLFNKDIPNTYVNGELYNPLQNLFNQYIYVHPDQSVMKDYSSPDELDSVSYAFAEIQKVITGLELSPYNI